MNEYQLSKYFPAFTEKDLREELLNKCEFHHFESKITLMEQGQYVKVLPLVLNGIVKVIKEDNEKQILMYYIKKGESCIMSISACISNEKSQIKAITESPTDILLIPYELVNSWLLKYPTWNAFVIASYKERFENMLDAFNAVAFQKMDTRLIHYLQEKADITDSFKLKITHEQIATDLGTARVVISRLLKDLENQGKIEQSRGSILILDF